MRISDWSSDVCSSDLCAEQNRGGDPRPFRPRSRVVHVQRLQLADDFLRLHWSAPSSSSPFLSSGRLSTLTLSVTSDLWSLFLSLVLLTTSRGSETPGVESRFFMYVELRPFDSAMPSLVTAPPAPLTNVRLYPHVRD